MLVRVQSGLDQVAERAPRGIGKVAGPSSAL